MSEDKDPSCTLETSPPRKRRCVGQDDKSGHTGICIVHIEGIKHGEIQLFSTISDADTRFAKLLDIKKQRLSQPAGSVHRMAKTCELIPDMLSEGHGYHRQCYKRFIMNLDRLKNVPEPSQSTPQLRASKRSSTDSDHILFKPDCIFCRSDKRKKIKMKGAWTTEGLSTFECDGWKNVLVIAEGKHDEDLLRRISGCDLFACEAKYHKSCRTQYLQRADKWRTRDDDEKNRQATLEQAHDRAFNAVCHIIDNDIIEDKKIVKLSELRDTYASSLQSSNFPNPDYRNENLKRKLEKHAVYKDKLSFCNMGRDTGRFQSCIVYNSCIDTQTAIRHAFELGSADMLKDAGYHLRQKILQSFQQSPELKWPPNAQELGRSENVLPDDLVQFLTYVISGRTKCDTARVQRLVSSIGQDVCRAATNGAWKLPKHILMCMTMRHLFRSAQLITLLNKMGHSENYSFSLELETGIAEAVEKASDILSTQIIRSPSAPSVFHSEFDNFDQLLNDLTGKNSIHTAHGIMLQDIEGDNTEHGGTICEAPSIPKSGHRSLKLTESVELPECYVTKRQSPNLDIQHHKCPGAALAFDEAILMSMLWILLRSTCQSLQQVVPGWSGFISLTGKGPLRLTTIDYYPVIGSPITEYKTVQECLRYAQEATEEVNQKYVITTFDLGVCMKALPITWNNPIKYENHIILIGTFHLICAYLKMVGKKMDGSGLADIFLEAGLIGSGSLNGVLSGRHYDRAMHCHKTLLECLERLLSNQFLAEHGDEVLFDSLSEDSRKRINDLRASPTMDTLEAALADNAIVSYIQDYSKYRSDCREGKNGKTAQLWLSYMDHIWLVLSLIQAVKTNNFLLYAHCLHSMAPIFFSFGGQNYARYLTYFSVFITNIEVSHPGATELLKRGAISVARSFIPGNRCAVDKTMEETFMRHAKSHGGAGGSGTGVSGLVTNYNAYQRWVRTTHAKSQFVNSTLNMADMLSQSENVQHHDVRPTEIRKSERCVQNTLQAVESFLNPFSVGMNDQLLILSSGAAATKEVETDVLQAESLGEKARDDFIATRLETGRDFFEPVKRLNLKTLGHHSKTVKVKSAKNQVIQYKQQGNLVFELFLKSQNEGLQLDLKQLVSFPLTPVPYSIGTADGYLAKTAKSKGFDYMTKDCNDALQPPFDETLIIYDGNASFYCLKELPNNFSGICTKVFDGMSKKGDTVFSTDRYLQNSVKSMERQRRGTGEKLIIRGGATKKPPDWKLFLSNDHNKEQFIQLLQREWGKDDYASKLHGRQVILICDGMAYHLTSEDGRSTAKAELPVLCSIQEETDSRIILYCLYGKENNYKHIRVKSPDSDVFFILLHYAPSMEDVEILFDTWRGNKQRLINVSELAQHYTQEHCTALMAAYAYSGCDTTSCFKGVGKIKPLKALQKMPRYIPALAKLGDTWDIPDELINDLDAFTCAIYGHPRVSTVDDLRLLKMKANVARRKNMDMGTLPPCRRSLIQHIRRVNYQVAIWKNAHVAVPNIPDPCAGHGWVSGEGTIEPLWYDGDMIPKQLTDIACDPEDTSDSDSDNGTEVEGPYFEDIDCVIDGDEDSDDE